MEKEHVFGLIFISSSAFSSHAKSEPVYLKSQSTSIGTTYHIAVYTGHRSGSGTTATPTMIISGEQFDTNSITLKSDDRKLFDRGTVETFLYTTNKVS